MSFRAALRLLVFTLLAFTASAEWVEIPQFSDRSKVYRAPMSLKKNQAHLHSNRRVYDNSAYTGITENPDYFGQKIGFAKDTHLRNVSDFSGTNRHPSFLNTEFVGTVATFTTERVLSNIEEEKKPITNDADSNEGVTIETFEDENISQFDELTNIENSNEDVVDNITDSTKISSTTVLPKKSQYTNETENDKGFLDYLPIDLLKKVHKTLKSQPPTLKEKIRFLKAFQRSLLTEIESRLNEVLAPSRTPRGARYHDEHEDSIGFPSLEGTLMAISFLTFAVYLVRLVMMLFRNAGNNGSNPIFIGRKKRSIDDFNEEAARILSYLDSSLFHHY